LTITLQSQIEMLEKVIFLIPALDWFLGSLCRHSVENIV
jgi:hypothetical protein